MVAIDAQAELTLELGKLSAQQARTAEVLRRALAAPSWIHQDAQATANASGFCLINLGGPEQGKLWMVMQCVAGGLLWATSAAGTSLLLVSTTDQILNSNSISLSSIRDESSTLPNVAFYSKDQVVVHGGENLFVAIQSGTASQVYVAGATITEYDEGARTQTYEL